MNKSGYRYIKTTCPHCKKKYELELPVYRYYQYKENWIEAAEKYGYDDPDKMMVTEYFKNKKTFREIGEMIGVTAMAVRSRMVNIGYKGKFRPRGGPYNVKKTNRDNV